MCLTNSRPGNECLLARSGSGTNGGLYSQWIHGVSAWCTRSIIVVPDQEQRPHDTIGSGIGHYWYVNS